jgi:hypothetical protein
MPDLRRQDPARASHVPQWVTEPVMWLPEHGSRTRVIGHLQCPPSVARIGPDLAYPVDQSLLHTIIERARAISMSKAIEVRPPPNREVDNQAEWSGGDRCR